MIIPCLIDDTKANVPLMIEEGMLWYWDELTPNERHLMTLIRSGKTEAQERAFERFRRIYPCEPKEMSKNRKSATTNK